MKTYVLLLFPLRGSAILSLQKKNITMRIVTHPLEKERTRKINLHSLAVATPGVGDIGTEIVMI